MSERRRGVRTAAADLLHAIFHVLLMDANCRTYLHGDEVIYMGKMMKNRNVGKNDGTEEREGDET